MLKKSIKLILFIYVFMALFVVKANTIGNYEITSKQEFIDLLLSKDADMAGSYILYDDLDFTTGVVTYNGEVFNLDEKGLDIIPIGEIKKDNGVYTNAFSNPFSGTFNGNGHVIKGVNIKSKDPVNEYVGLFGYNSGIISNLGLVDSTVDGGIHVGGIAGYNIGTILGCYNTSLIKGLGTVGGISGMNYGYIRNSYNTGQVNGTTKVGGIVGQNSSILTAVYDIGIISGTYNEDGSKEFGYIFGYNTAQGVIGYVEDNKGMFNFGNSLQKYSKAGAYYPSNFGSTGLNVGYDKLGTIAYDNVNAVKKTLNELKNINNYDPGFIQANTNILPIGSNYTHQTTGFFIKSISPTNSYSFPVVGTSEATSTSHTENGINKYNYKGKGTIYDPYIVSTEEELQNIKYNLFAPYILNNNIELTNPFTPIGDEISPFRGIFNGNGYRISNLNFNTNSDYLGLFSFNYGIIHNVSIDANINNPTSSKVGTIAGFNGGLIYESYAIGSLNGYNILGGLVGSNGGRLNDSYSHVNINGVSDLGGIAGYSSGYITNTYSTKVPSGSTNIGGIVGYLENLDKKVKVFNSYHFSTNQIGYESNTSSPKSLEKLANLDDLKNINNFPTFDISSVESGNVGTTIWSIENGVNNGYLYLTNTPPIRVKSLEFNVTKELEEDNINLSVFDKEGSLILGTSIDIYGYTLDLNEWLLFNPLNAENKNVSWEIISQVKSGLGDVVDLSGSIITGLNGGEAILRVTTMDGSISKDLKVIVQARVYEVVIVNKEGGSINNPEDVVKDSITVENFSTVKLYSYVGPIEAKLKDVVWTSNKDFVTVDDFGNIAINYTYLTENEVIDGLYKNKVSAIIRATSVDNDSIYDEVEVIITPSNKNTLEEDLSIYENGLKLNLQKSGLLYTFNQEIKYNTDYVVLDFNLTNNQSYTLSSLEALTVEDKSVYLSRGTIVNNNYLNRENTIELTIFSESKIPYTYTIKLTKALSPINSINRVTGVYNYEGVEKPLEISFSNDVVYIKTKLPYGDVSVSLYPSLLDIDSQYSKSVLHSYSYIINGILNDEVGYLPKKQGSNQIILRVTSEDLSTKDYVIEYQMTSSNNNYLQDLFVGINEYENLISFDKYNNVYNIELEYNNNFDLYIEATHTLDESNNPENKIFISYGIDLEISNLTISSPSEGQTDKVFVKVISLADVEAGNENYNIYEINISKAYDSDTSLYNLKVNDEDIVITKDVFDYTKVISEEVDLVNLKLDFNYKNSIEVRHVSYKNVNNLTTIINKEIMLNNFLYPLDINSSGTYLIAITIKNPDESSISIYNIEIIKRISSNSILSEIKVIDEILNNTYDLSLANDFIFDGVNKYSISNSIFVNYSVYQIKISGNIHSNAKYGLISSLNYNSGEEVTISLKTGVNEITLRVLAEDESYTDYVFIINRSKSSDANLTNLSVKKESYNLINNFNASTYLYSIGDIGTNTNKLLVDFGLTSPIIGGKLGTETFDVINGNLTITKLKNGSYELSNIDYGNYKILITVLSENEEVTNTYTVEFSKEKSNDSRLSSLKLSNDKVNNLVSDFNYLTYYYNLGDLSKDVTKLYLSAIPNDNLSKVSYLYLNSELNFVNQLIEIELIDITKGSNIIEVHVQAQDESISIYKLEFNRIASNDNLLSSLKVVDNLGKVQIGENIHSPSLIFDNKVNTYNLNLNPSINTLSFNPILNDKRAIDSYSLNGIDFITVESSFNINLGWNNDNTNNDIVIRVIAEDGNINDYVVSYSRYKDSSSLITEVSSTEATFVKNNNTYNAVVNYEFDSIDVNITLDSNYATLYYSFDQTNYLQVNKINDKYIINSVDLELGLNYIYLQVVAQDNTLSNYLIEINRLNLYYNILLTSNGGGTIIHDELTNIPLNTVIVLEIIPDSYYHIKSIKVNGNEIITLNNNTPLYTDSHLTYGNGKYYYTFDPIISNQEIAIEFEVNKYKVNLKTNNFGTLNDSISSDLDFSANTEINIVIKPEIGHHLNKILINGIETIIDLDAYKPQEEIINGYKYLLTSSITKDLTVEAEFIKNTYTVTYKSNGYFNSYGDYVDLGNIDGSYYSVEEETFTYEYGELLGVKTINSIEGYLSSWSIASSYVVKSDLTIYGNYIALDEITLRFIIDGNTVKYTSKLLTPPNVDVTFDTSEFYQASNKLGYTFKWYLNGEEFDSDSNLTISEDTDIIGVYSLIEYDINYNLDGGVNPLNNITKYNVTTNFVFNNPTKEGYIFDGWYKELEFINKVLEIKSGQTDSIELFAKFIPSNNTKYKVMHMIENLDKSYTIFETLNLTGTTNTFVSALNKDILGFTFNLDHKDNVTEGIILPDGSLELYLYYTRNSYVITVNIIGEGSITSINSSYKYNEEITVEATPNLGNSFTGWYILDNLQNSNSKYTFKMPANDLEINARFNLDTYNITYHLNDGILEMENPLTYNIYTEDIILNNPIKVGHTFNGWYTNPEFFGESVTVISKGGTKDITLYAYFIIDTFDIEVNIIGDGKLLLDGVEVIDSISRPYGSKLKFTFDPSLDYFVNSFKVNGEQIKVEEEYIIENLNNNYFVEIEFIKTEPDLLTLKPDSGYGNKIYNIDRSGEINLFLNYFLNQKAGDIRLCFENSQDRIKFYNITGVEITDDKILGTGYIIKLYKDNSYTEVIDEVFIILSGDVNGDGRANATDLNFVYRHVKMTLLITDQIKNKAGNLTTGKTITATSLNLLYRHVKMTSLLYKNE